MCASAENTNAENTNSESSSSKPDDTLNFVLNHFEDAGLEYVETKFPAINKLPPEELLLQTYDESRERFNISAATEVENAEKFAEPITVQIQTAKYVRKPTDTVTKSRKMMEPMCFGLLLCTKMFCRTTGRTHHNIVEPIVEPSVVGNDYLHRNNNGDAPE